MNKLKVTFSDSNILVNVGTLAPTALFYCRLDVTSLYMVVEEKAMPVPARTIALKESYIQAVNLMTGELLTIKGETRVYLATGELVAQAQGYIG